MRRVRVALFLASILLILPMINIVAIPQEYDLELLEENRHSSTSIYDRIGLSINFQNTLFFVAKDGSSGNELWKSDGTATGTVLVKDIMLDTSTSLGSNPWGFTIVGDELLFSADDGVHGEELWKTDGTEAGTVMIKDINPGSDDGPNLGSGTYPVIDGTLYFSADDGVHGEELWKTDGTEAGTVMVKDIKEFEDEVGDDSWPGSITAVGTRLYFSAWISSDGRELWAHETTSGSTWQVANINEEVVTGTSFDGSSYPDQLTVVGSTLYFHADDGVNGKELWKTTADGTTTMVEDIYSGSDFSYPQYLTAVGSSLYFSADDGVNGVELWRTGTDGVTYMVKNINSGSESSSPKHLTAIGNTLYFVASDGGDWDDKGLWKTDGTEAGTVLVRNNGGYGPHSPSYPLVVDNILYIRGSEADPSSGSLYDNDGELWKSDGTHAGTVLVKGFQKMIGPSFVEVNSKIYFEVKTLDNREELWVSDGTESGTQRVMEIEDSGNGGSGNNGDIPINSEGTLDQYNAGNSNEYIIDIDSYTDTFYGGIDAIYTIGGSNPRICTISLASDAWEFDTQSETCVSGQYSHVDVTLLGNIYSVLNDRTLMAAFDSLADIEEIYTFSSDITAILDVDKGTGIVAVATEDGKLRLIDTWGSDGVLDTMTPVGSSIYITTFGNDALQLMRHEFYAGFSDGSIIDFEIDPDDDWENYELVKGEREITSGGGINAISVMSPMSFMGSAYSDLVYSDGSMTHGLQSSDYSMLWSGNGGRSSSITDLDDSLSCYVYIAHEEGSVSEVGTCDFDSSNHFNNTALHDFTSSYSGSCGCSKVVGIDWDYPRSFFATAGSSLYIIYREPTDGGGENGGGPGGDVSVIDDYIIQLPNHSWKEDVLCKVELLCFAKMVASADNNDRLTYIDQDITVTLLNTDGTENIEAVISDENGNIVKRESMICTAYSGNSGCTAEITVQTSNVKSQLFETTMNTLHDGMEQYFESQAEGRATDLFVKIAIPVICAVVGVVAGLVSVGTAAIPTGVGCVHALWTLYGIVKSVSFLLSLVTYYNIVDDNLGIYENKVFPNHYLSAIEVDGVVHDIQDHKLERLNDVSQWELESFGEHDKLEFFGFSPVDFKLYRDGQTTNDDEDLFQITGNSPLEALLVINPDNDDALRVEGTGSGVYSLVGIYNDADISSTDSVDEEAPFATAFLIEKDTQISNGQTVTYLDYDYWSWDEEAELKSEEQDSTTSGWSNSSDGIAILDAIVVFLLISGLIAAVVVFIRKRREKSPPIISAPFVTGQQVPIVPNQPQIPQPLHTHEVISAPPPQNQFVAPAPVYDPIPSVEQQWVDNQGRTWRRLNNGCTQMWNGTNWQDI